MPASPTPRVTGFADAGTSEHPIVCVHVESGELGVWIGRRYPGSETHLVADVAVKRHITIQEAQRILDGWPATQGNAGDALQAAAWQGRRQLIGPRLHERMRH
jgi:hypothetical protein